MTRMFRNVPLAALVALFLGAGCGSRPESGAPSATGETAIAAPSADSGGHAEGIVPGSYADWCAEHGVPETKCTRCDPSLIAAFKATGDWCEEHGLPKTQDLACNPDLKIVRAPAPEGVQ